MKSLAALVSVVIFSMFVAACSGGQPAPPTPQPTTPPAPTPTQPVTNGGGNNVKVSLRDPGGSGSYLFAPSEFTFSAGQTVTFVLTSETEFHTFTVDDLEIDVEVDAGETEEITVTFDEAGEFPLICIPHQFLDMTGTITVQ